MSKHGWLMVTLAVVLLTGCSGILGPREPRLTEAQKAATDQEIRI